MILKSAGGKDVCGSLFDLLGDHSDANLIKPVIAPICLAQKSECLAATGYQPKLHQVCNVVAGARLNFC